MSALLLAAHLLMIDTQWAPNQVLNGHGCNLAQLVESRTGCIFLVRQQTMFMPELHLGQSNKRVKGTVTRVYKF